MSTTVTFTGDQYTQISPTHIKMTYYGGVVDVTVDLTSTPPNAPYVYTWSKIVNSSPVVFRTTNTNSTSDTANSLGPGSYTVVITGDSEPSSVTVTFDIDQSDLNMFAMTVSQSCVAPSECEVVVVCDNSCYISLEDVQIVKGLIKCCDGKFYLYINNITPEATYPLTLTINNTLTGKYYTFIIQQFSGYYSVPVCLGAGCYIVTMTDSYGITQTRTFEITRPLMCKVTLNSCGSCDNSRDCSCDRSPSQCECSNANSCSNSCSNSSSCSESCNKQKCESSCKNPCTQTLKCFGCNTGELTACVVQDTRACGSCVNSWCDTLKYSYRWTKDGEEYNPVTHAVSCKPIWTVKCEDPITSMKVCGLTAGCYKVYVKEICVKGRCTLESCAVVACAKICQPDPIRIKICPDKIHLDCNGDSDGKFSVWAIGGTPSYKYTLKDSEGCTVIAGPQDCEKFKNLSAGEYKVVVTDSNCCTATESVTITEPEPIVVKIVTIHDSCGTKLKAIATGGTTCCCSKADNEECSQGCSQGKSPVVECYRYEWVNRKNCKNVISTSSCTGPLTDGSYEVTVYDSKCCLGRACAEVKCVPLCIKVKKLCDTDCTFRIKVTVENGKAPFRYEVNGACLDDDIECYVFSIKNKFTLKVIDSNGCVGETTF